MAHLGDFVLETTIYAKFCTVTTTGAPTVLAGTPVVSVYENDDNTQITAGVTLNVDEDGVVGLNQLVIAATAANGYEAGKFYDAVITTGTVGGTSVVGYCVASFTIQATSALRPTTAARTLDVSAGGEAGIDWANVGSPTTTLALSGTTVATVTTTGTATAVTTVNGLANNVITAASIAADAITDAKVASDVTIASVTGAVGSVTGAVGSVTGNVGGNVTGSVGSVVGAVGSVTGNVGGNVVGSTASVAGAVGSVTGNVGGNVSGSVGSVVGAVGSVTGAVGSVTGNVTGSIGSLAAQAKTDVNTEVLDVLVTDTFAEPAAVPSATASLKDKIGWQAVIARNKVTQTATTQLVRNDADSGTIGTSTVSDDGTTAIRGEFA